MDEFFRSLASPAWWLSVVIVGLLVNLLSAYLKAPLDRVWALIFVAWRERNARARSAYRSRIENLSRDENGQFHLLLEALRLRSTANSWLIALTLATVLYCADILLRAAEIAANVKLPSPDYFDPNAGALAVLLAIISALMSFRCREAAISRELLVRQARQLVSGEA
jgi:hypothetical protein